MAMQGNTDVSPLRYVLPNGVPLFRKPDNYPSNQKYP